MIDAPHLGSRFWSGAPVYGPTACLVIHAPKETEVETCEALQ
ncbi:hypothetical protein [Maritimibacter dapengensis]|nr:hypothetical protein [Maritimibacter dapengensis]